MIKHYRFFLSATCIVMIISISACNSRFVTNSNGPTVHNKASLPAGHPSAKPIPKVVIDTKGVDPLELVNFAKTLLGTKYKYGSAVKENGFDCSGLITYVFNKFMIQVPRTSINFTNAGRTINLESAVPGDLILFTGTDTTGWNVGHMGIITENHNGNVKFIHSSSGRNVGVTISVFSQYYSSRFVKVVRVFN